MYFRVHMLLSGMLRYVVLFEFSMGVTGFEPVSNAAFSHEV